MSDYYTIAGNKNSLKSIDESGIYLWNAMNFGEVFLGMKCIYIYTTLEV